LTFLREKVDLFEEKGQPSLEESSIALRTITLTLLFTTGIFALISHKLLDGSFTPIDDYHLGHIAPL